MNFSSGLSLEKLRDALVRQEDTIIFALIERSQFAANSIIYKSNQFPEINTSFLDYFLHQVECVHAKVRRYTSPDEYPFTTGLPSPILKPIILIENDINVNNEIKKMYVERIIPLLCKDAIDDNFGSSATKDVEALQAISKRIHMGKFVAEAKFNDPAHHDKYCELIRARDRQGLMQLLTNELVEEKLLKRLVKKAEIYGREIDEEPTVLRIPADLIANLYREFVIPMTKYVEVEYLLQRLNHA